MSEQAGPRDTIWIEESVHPLYRQLTDGSDPVGAPFRSMKDLFLWAACLGHQLSERRPLTGKRVNILRSAVFTPQADLPLVRALAIAATGDVQVLLNQEEMMTLVEEYANAGIHALRSAVLDEHGRPLWNLVALLGGHDGAGTGCPRALATTGE